AGPIPLHLLPDSASVGLDGRASIGGCDLVDLADEYGTPLFVYDEDHLCIQGFESSPLTLPGLDEGSSYVLSVAVCGYQTGERDTEVTGQVRFRADGLYDEEVDWSFVPVRDLGVDTGS
ncbi:MAG: hypothetical protein QGG40_21590, partial [Myxococcota bacterium]|nr:hypothetical protein [Myxococcota bacterium]